MIEKQKIFLPSGLNINNIDKIKEMLTHILLDKNISNILYNSNIDFYGQINVRIPTEKV